MTEFFYKLKVAYKTHPINTIIASWTKDEKIFLENPDNALTVPARETGIPENYLKLLKSPELFNMITEQELNKIIEGELETRKTIFLISMGVLVSNKQPTSANLCVNDDSGTGKDYITKNTLSILPKETLIKKTRISPTTLTYWHQKKFEPDWDWNPIRLYLEDISEDVFNSPVFKVYASGGTSSTIVIHQRAIDIEISGKPALFVTFAATEPNPELLRRFPLLNLDSSINQTKAIMRKQAEFAFSGKSMELNPEITKALAHLKLVKVRIPFAERLVEKFPNQNTIMRTQFPRFLDYIKFSTAFFQFQREQDNENFFLSTGQDYDLARLALLKTTSNQFMIPLTKNQKKILEKLESFKGSSFYFSDIQSKISFISKTPLWENLSRLCNYGFLERSTEKKEGTDRPFTIFNYIGTKSLIIPTWKDLSLDE